jgi:hypothetical protein
MLLELEREVREEGEGSATRKLASPRWSLACHVHVLISQPINTARQRAASHSRKLDHLKIFHIDILCIC